MALQKSDAVDVIDTAGDRVVETLRVGQEPMALVYVAGAARHGDGRDHLTRQGLGRRVTTLPVEIRGAPGTARVTVRDGTDANLLDITARGLPPYARFTAYGIRPDRRATALRTLTADASGAIDQTLAFTDFVGIYKRVVMVEKGEEPPSARLAVAWTQAVRSWLCEPGGTSTRRPPRIPHARYDEEPPGG